MTVAKSTLLIQGMLGLGDCIYQRAIVRQKMERHDIWLETPWPAVYHDLGVKLVLPSMMALRTQTKNAKREAGLYVPRPAKVNGTIRLTYQLPVLRQRGTILEGLLTPWGGRMDIADYRLPIPAAWHARADAVLARLQPTKPVLIYRPLTERAEWGGCRSRNPDHHAYAEIFAAIRERFFVISIADLVPLAEWIVGKPITADAEFHKGELDFEALAALTSRASAVYTAPGFMLALAQAVEVPTICIFGGHESSRVYVEGARHAPFLGIDPIKPCNCFTHTHACEKAINIESAQQRIREFTAGVASKKMITIAPSRDSTLYSGDHPIRIGDTTYGGRAFVETYRNKNRETAIHVEWMKSRAKSHPSITVVDVGANAGLFSRQALIALPNIAHAFAYEPDADNFDAMTANLKPWADRLTLRHCALGDQRGIFKLYRDASNGGNCSFLREAMAAHDFDTSLVSMRLASVESMDWINAGYPILYKSDAQGYDELIATALDPRVWDQVFGAVFEIWRIAKPDCATAFRNILERYPNRVLLNAQRTLTVNAAVEFASGRDGIWDDLAVWR